MTAATQSKTLSILGGLFLFMAAAVMIAWFVGGGHMVTQYQVKTTVVEEDEFGDEMEREVMQDQFQLGLLPDKGYDAAAPWSAGFGVLGIVLLFVGRRKKKAAEHHASNPSDATSSQSGAPQ